jgi:hypothetical protein
MNFTGRAIALPHDAFIVMHKAFCNGSMYICLTSVSTYSNTIHVMHVFIMVPNRFCLNSKI